MLEFTDINEAIRWSSERNELVRVLTSLSNDEVRSVVKDWKGCGVYRKSKDDTSCVVMVAPPGFF